MATGTPISNNIINKVNRNRVVIFLLRRLGVTGDQLYSSLKSFVKGKKPARFAKPGRFGTKLFWATIFNRLVPK